MPGYERLCSHAREARQELSRPLSEPTYLRDIAFQDLPEGSLNKLIPIQGDIELDGLGLSDQD